MLSQRLLTAAIGIPIILGLIVAGGIWLALLLAVIAGAMGVELARLLRGRNIMAPSWAIAISAAAFCLAPVIPDVLLDRVLPAVDRDLQASVLAFAVTLAAALAAALSFEKPAPPSEKKPGADSEDRSEDRTFKDARVHGVDDEEVEEGEEPPPTGALAAFVGVMFGSLYVGYLLSLLMRLRLAEDGIVLILSVVLAVWANDTAAYFVGKRFGSTKLAPKISPNKTVEGAFGGLAAGIAIFILAIAVGSAISPPESGATLPFAPVALFIVALAVAVAAQAGDLFESAIKRKVDIKDSGSILPGHGGVLDRFDSMLFAGAAAYLGYIALGL